MGFASFVLNGQLYCGSVAVHSRPDGGIRLVWPKISNRGVQYPTVHPITKGLSDSIEESVGSSIVKLLPHPQ